MTNTIRNLFTKHRRMIAAAVGGAGLALIADHLLTYGWTMHFAPIDHGVAGLVLFILAVLLAAAPWRPS